MCLLRRIPTAVTLLWLAALAGCAATQPESPPSASTAVASVGGPADAVAPLQPDAAERFAGLALDCIHREYPNKIAHVLASDEDVGPPRELTPAFYGCFDWHSAVHGHWMLVRLLRARADATFAKRARAAVGRSLTVEHIEGELAYLGRDDRAGFERPYGLAWLLQLGAELRGWDDPDARRWAEAVAPLERLAARRLAAWIPKLTHPIRSGEHSQTAFAFGLALDWARTARDDDLAATIERAAQRLYGDDAGCNLAFEPSGHDFLSPCLGAADLMRRVLAPPQFAAWLQGAIVGIPKDGSAAWLRPAKSPDRSDGKLAHLDGLNLSRAWMLEGIATGLPTDDPRRAAIRAAAAEHARAGLAAVTGEHYEGGHWLGSFAVYLTTRRGLPE